MTTRTLAPSSATTGILIPAAGPSPAVINRRRQRRNRAILSGASIFVVLAGYTLVSNLPGSNPAVIPPPQQIWGAFLELLNTGQLAANVPVSIFRVLTGFAIGSGCAIILGSLVGWFRPMEYIFDPLIEALRPVPPLAYIPLIIIWVGIGDPSSILVISLSAFLTCVVPVASGMRQVPRTYVEASETLGASRFTVFRTVAIPSSIPYIFTGLRIAIGASWTTLVAAELVGAQTGLGVILQNGRRYFQTDNVIVGILIVGILAFSMDQAARFTQKQLTKWSEVSQ